MSVTMFRKDYAPLPFHIAHTDLQFDLSPDATIVTNKMTVNRTEHGSAKSKFSLQGEGLDLQEVLVNGKPLADSAYTATPDSLVIHKLPKDCTVTVKTKLNPSTNKSCNGLYRSEGFYTTQCESENFRKITYFYDRPDNLATYTTTIVADKATNPVLLSNGDLVEEKVLPDGRHQRTFNDPNPKPSYLFALVAGDLRMLQDHFETEDGRSVALQIFAKGEKIASTTHAMDCLKKAMAWDEATYKLPYDLNVYNIVGVPDFNAGAMENKGLNIFNDSALLVTPQTGTDRDYQWIYTVVGHEFFHNYAGNRVTVKNWFELSLKEGLATQKEREFLADQIGYTLPRIENVNVLRSIQFPEDAGPNAHSVRIDSYQDISNCYTTTTYYKGSELLSMLSTLLGQEVWRRGVTEYFKRLDGTAATIEEFLEVLSDVSGKDLTQFLRWYTQAGTPRLHFEEVYDASAKTYTLKVRQECPATPNQPHKQPFHIPIKMGLLSPAGKPMALQLEGEGKAAGLERVLELTEQEQTFVFKNVKSKPTASLLRDFSAPVIVETSPYSNDDLMFLMAHDANEFNRYEAANQLHQRMILDACEALRNGKVFVLSPKYVEANRAILVDPALSPGLKAKILAFPSETVLLNAMVEFSPQRLRKAMGHVAKSLGQNLKDEYEHAYHDCKQDCSDAYSPENAGKRSLKNLCLGRLVGSESAKYTRDSKGYVQQAHKQFQTTQNLTDKLAALKAVYGQDFSKMSDDAKALAREMSGDFYESAKHNSMLMSNWLNVQACYDGPDTLEHMRRMTQHEAFSYANPNDVRDLLRVFVRTNHKHLHDPTGAGYHFMVDCCLALDGINPESSAGIAKSFTSCNNLDPERLAHMVQALRRLQPTKMSKEMGEVVGKALMGFESKLEQARQLKLERSDDEGAAKVETVQADAQNAQPVVHAFRAQPRRSTRLAAQQIRRRGDEEADEPVVLRRSKRLASKQK